MRKTAGFTNLHGVSDFPVSFLPSSITLKSTKKLI